ncbi:hypothetical protein RHS04_07079 [Rhizoctonia solani]|uniref:Uncharacterized protein n=1 Tax=Rhizoctonia solani TaxID=456999 RepID=A0A8H7H3P3_9AGAM|nr:hypothetical protein RHS04_07079 [Rhizoctonia solani]
MANNPGLCTDADIMDHSQMFNIPQLIAPNESSVEIARSFNNESYDTLLSQVDGMEEDQSLATVANGQAAPFALGEDNCDEHANKDDEKEQLVGEPRSTSGRKFSGGQYFKLAHERAQSARAAAQADLERVAITAHWWDFCRTNPSYSYAMVPHGSTTLRSASTSTPGPSLMVARPEAFNGETRGKFSRIPH